MSEGGAAELVLRGRRFAPSQFPLVMGILNVTPDSFSDGGEHFDLSDAVGHALEMIRDGADIIDVGGESTRPGATATPAEEQIRRTVPVIKAIRSRDEAIPISIDTRSASVAEAALEVGADLINDISAFRDDPEMVRLAAGSGAPAVLMHRKGTSATMQAHGGPQYDDVVGEVCDFVAERVRYAVDHGVESSRLIIDPGIGFGKRVEHNMSILRHLDRFVALGHPVLVWASRKSFIGKVLNGAIERDGRSGGYTDDPKRREGASLACVVMAAMAGAAIVRVHSIRPAVEAIRLCSAVKQAE